MSKQLIAVLAGGLAVLALAIAGCGGDDDDEAAASPITKAEFIKQADAACKKGEQQTQVAFGAFVAERRQEGEASLKPNQETYSELVDAALVPQVEQEVAELRELGAPAGDEEQVDAFVDAREEAIELAEANPSASVTDGSKIFGKSDTLAAEYGLKICGSR
jgi:predicted outer membrane protein